jgi:hypothetical protein
MEPGFRAQCARELAAARKLSSLCTALVLVVDTAELWLATAAGPTVGGAEYRPGRG